MSKKELETLLKDNSSEIAHELSASDIVDLRPFVNVSLQIDKKTLDYYYEIDVDELLNSKMSFENYETLQKQGWSLIDNKLILILKTQF